MSLIGAKIVDNLHVEALRGGSESKLISVVFFFYFFFEKLFKEETSLARRGGY